MAQFFCLLVGILGGGETYFLSKSTTCIVLKSIFVFIKYKEQVQQVSYRLLQDGRGWGRFWSVGVGGLLPMAALKGHGCTRALTFSKLRIM